MEASWLFDWVVWASLGIGVLISGLVFFVGRFVRPPRLRKWGNEDNLPWEQLLELMKERYGHGKSPADEELSPDQLMELLLSQVPAGAVVPQGVNWTNGHERRRSRRRSANPVEVLVMSPLQEKLARGVVVNRSTGGMAIMTDAPFDTGAVLSVRPVEAPKGVGYAHLYVRHSQKKSRFWVLGCEYRDDTPWNVKVWFG
jgi:hypothetical protein